MVRVMQTVESSQWATTSLLKQNLSRRNMSKTELSLFIQSCMDGNERAWELTENESGDIILKIVFKNNKNGKDFKELIENLQSGQFPPNGTQIECSVASNKKEKPEEQCQPHRLVCVEDYEAFCKIYLDKISFDYFAAGSLTELTRDSNKSAFRSIRLSPKHLIDVSNPIIMRNIGVTGQVATFPVGISPTALHQRATPEGEIATVRAAKNMGVVYISSIDSNTKLEDIAEAEPNAMRWQQTYMLSEDFMLDLLCRAESAGVTAIVLTIDKPDDMIYWNGENYLSEPPKVPNYPNGMEDFRTDVTWDHITWLCEQTFLPVILKGVMTPEDVRMAIQAGAKGVIVSNHGGRCLEGLPATMDILRDVVKVAEGKLEVFMDGGIRTGLDVFKALAYGARMVFIGRPALWGLGHSGQAGLENVLNILKKELLNTMMLAGTPTLDDITMDRIFLPRN